MGQSVTWFLWKCQSEIELEREGLMGNQLTWKKSEARNWKKIHPEYYRMSFTSLRNSNSHLLLRKWCRCLFASLLAASSLGSTVCLKICRLNLDLRPLAKQRKTALVSVIYICVFAKAPGFFSSLSRSFWLVLYYKEVIKMKWNPTALLHPATHTPFFIRDWRGYLSCQLFPDHHSLLLFSGQTVVVELLPPQTLRSKHYMDSCYTVT